MTEQHFDPAAVERVKAFLDARDRFAASAREQGANPHLNNIAHQADAAAVLAPFYDAYDRPGSASYPLNTDDLQQLLDRLDFRAKEGEQLAEQCQELRRRLDDAITIIRRVQDHMHAYGHGMVTVRQVLDLLSPTWPDGNYAAAVGDTEG